MITSDLALLIFGAAEHEPAYPEGHAETVGHYSVVTEDLYGIGDSHRLGGSTAGEPAYLLIDEGWGAPRWEVTEGQVLRGDVRCNPINTYTAINEPAKSQAA